ncbi:MAG: 3-deoxy-manno-octulosonate cytidylyltransferase [Phycisphaerales bacterium]|nr:MAG: 3-deoxy-manno-octulosonate cytidylyltransferase [Phycisphaerales bacterium]
MTKAVAIIPARFDSTRFPGKALADKTGKPLIQHVYEQVRQAECVGEVIVATDDPRILEAVSGFGGQAVLTRRDHPNGTSRIAEVAESLDDEIIVNIQGDEVEIEPALIDLAVRTLQEQRDCPVSTLASPFAADEDPSDPNLVKVVLDHRGRALYFSRALIPHLHEKWGGETYSPPLKHVGMYVYCRPFLAEYVSLPATPLERTERLEQLRVLEHGYPMAVAVGEAHFHGIDTPEQYEEFVRRYAAR